MTDLLLGLGLIFFGLTVIGLQNQVSRNRKAISALAKALDQLIEHTIDIAEDVNKLSAIQKGKN